MRSSFSLFLLLAYGCADAPAEESRAPVLDQTDSLVLEVEIGDEPGTEFSYVADVAVAEDGSMYVLDSRSRYVSLFDSIGGFVRTFGGQGDGPGEFRSPISIAVDDGSVLVWDMGTWRLTTFNFAGDVLSTAPIPPRRESGWPAIVRYSNDGEWLYLDQEIESPHQEGVEVTSRIIRGTARLLSWSGGPEWRELAKFPGMEAALVEGGGELSLANAPFPAGPLWAVGPEGSTWYADSRYYAIVQLDSVGDTIAAVAVSMRGPAVTDSAWEAFVGGRSGDIAAPDARRRSRLPRPDAQPVLASMLSARNGDLWVQLRNTGGNAVEWHVYTHDGSPRFKVILPHRFQIDGVYGQWIIGNMRDSLDVQTVRRYRIDGGARQRFNGG